MSGATMGRRPFLVAGMAGVAALAGLAYVVPQQFRPRYKPTPFDDLLGKLPDRENAVRLGTAFLREHADFDSRKAAVELRVRLSSTSLAAVLDEDLNRARMVEVHGWVLPETLAALCALAAA